MKITNFCTEELHSLYITGIASSIPPELHSRIYRRLFAFRVAKSLNDFMLPGYPIKQLGDTNVYSVPIDDNVFLLFRLVKGDMADVTLWPWPSTKPRRVPKELVSRQTSFHTCFISYGRLDLAFARKLQERLSAKRIKAILDQEVFRPGVDLYEEIAKNIRACGKVLLCCSRHSLKSRWVDIEITAAFDREQELAKRGGNRGRLLIPLDLDGFIHSWKNGKAAQIRARVMSDFTGWENDNEKFRNTFELLVRELEVARRGARVGKSSRGHGKPNPGS